MLAWVWFGVRLFDPKKNICFGFLKGQGCVESKNKTSAKRKSTMSSLDPSMIQVASFKCRADVPLRLRITGAPWGEVSRFTFPVCLRPIFGAKEDMNFFEKSSSLAFFSG